MSRHAIPLGNGRSEKFEIPNDTEVKAVANLRPQLERGEAAAKAAERRLGNARAARLAFDADAKSEVRAAARAGESSPSKKLVKRLRAIEEEVVEAELEYEGAIAVMTDLRTQTLATLVKHAPALRAEAVADVDADMLKLATLHGKLREIQAGYDEHSGTLGLLERLRTGKSPIMTHSQGAATKANNALVVAADALAEAVRHVTALRDQSKAAPLPVADEAPVDDATPVVDPEPDESRDRFGDLDARDLEDDE